MCDEYDLQGAVMDDTTVSRRGLGLLAVGAAALAGGVAHAADAKVVEKAVDVKTDDGTADAALFHPEGRGPWPAVLIWTDRLSLRPAFREMGRRLAAQGYVVLVPNPFYRVSRAPVVTGPIVVTDPVFRARLDQLSGSITPEGTVRDARAYVAFLDAQPQTDKTKKMGVHGYCSGGSLAVRTAAAVPDRIAAVGSFHGAALVTKAPTSPHLLIGQTKARYLFCVATDDDQKDPEAKTVLKATLEQTGRPGTVEVYRGNHHWCISDTEPYNPAEAERAWAALSAMYKTALV